ncbi:MAG TPA: hypothetical protein VG015_09660, partial [Candidatus Dormibacteraeota bacterium]|nr:hypothetical protein [Candidatus Dormibacteraeota bacterium]
NFVGAVLLASDDRTSTHKTILSDAAGAVLQKIAELPPASWTTLIQVLNTEQAEHHLQVFFNNPKVETSVSSLGWTSNLNPTAQPDFLMEVEANLAGDKANQDLVRAYHITLTQAGTTLHHQVVVDLTNNNPANATWGTNYDTYVRFYTEAGATNLKLSDGTAVGNQWWPLQPQDYPDKDVPAGFQIQDGYLQLDHLEAPSNHYQLIFDYDTTYQPNAQGTYSIYWQKEPGTMADPIDITWQTGGQTYKASGDLSVDRSIVLSATTIQLGVGQTSNAQIPGVSFG